jgi:phenylpropionate dioxygenase-like ring-hydroxylating dioxygenase large terminal subunit
MDSVEAMTEIELPERKVATLETLSASQIAAIRSLPPHDQAHATMLDERRSAAIFTDPARFDLEQAHVFKRMAVPVTLSVMLPSPNSFLAHEGYGLPLLLSRDKAGQVRAFLNVCQHKGSKLVETCEPIKAGRVVCPYHAWTYGADGRLVGIAREEVFPPGLKDQRRLTELPCKEAGGLIWVMLDRKAEPDFSGAAPELVDDLDHLGIPTAHVYGRRTYPLRANWKLVLEPFLEGYHVVRLHAESIGTLFADVPNAVHRLGPNIRQISGKANFMPEMLDIPGENIHKTLTHAYTVFPNTVIVTSPYYTSVMFIMPKSVNESVVEYFMLTPGPADNPKAEDVYARSYELIQKVFGTEDFRAACISQEGLESGGVEEVIYGGLEKPILEHYRTLEAMLAQA